MIGYLFLALTSLSAIFAAYKESYIGLCLFLVSCTTVLILRAQELKKPDSGVTHQETLKYFDSAVNELKSSDEKITESQGSLSKRLDKLENEMSKISLGQAFGKKK